MLIAKASGETEEFSSAKLRESLARTGASEEVIEMVMSAIAPQIHHGVKSSALHSLAFGLLRKYNRPCAAKYSIKRALMDLGPTGYPFERLISALLQKRGYEAKAGITVQGACVQHEIDVLAHKDTSHKDISHNNISQSHTETTLLAASPSKRHQIFAECKFHNSQGVRTDVKTALYVYARFLDVAEAFRRREDHSTTTHYEQWLVSNTRFTGDAAQYAACKGMTLLGWDYPQENGLQHIITSERLYPLTCLTTLTFAQKRGLLSRHIVLCQEVPEHIALLKHSLAKGQEQRLRQEIEQLLS